MLEIPHDLVGIHQVLSHAVVEYFHESDIDFYVSQGHEKAVNLSSILY